MLKESKRNFLLAWIMANSIGVAAGWMFGEFVGQWNLLLAWFAFEIPIWLLRGIVLRQIQEYKVWKPIDFIIWISAEFVGYVIGLGFQENGGEWVTAGSVYSLVIGASMWFLFFAIKQAKAPGKLWFLSAILWAFGGFIVANIITTVGIVLGLEIVELFASYSYPLLGSAMAGAVLGAIIGAMTGVALIGLLKKPEQPDNYSNWGTMQ